MVTCLLALLILIALGAAAAPARAAGIDLPRLGAERTEQGVLLSFETRFDLPAAVVEALQKGVALHFVADVSLLRERWYWRDQRVAQLSRTWRLSYQPLTQTYRVGLSGLNQNFASLEEALRALQRTSRWRLADPIAADDDGRYVVEFSYRLDASQLPRPLQIGVGGQPEWQLAVEHSFPLPPEPAVRRD
jgi:hypothetical protein